MASDVQGSFSFTMTAQWDYVKKKQLQKYIDNPYQISIDKRIDMKSAVEQLLSGGKWKPYSSVSDIKDTYNNENNERFPFSDETMETRRPLYNEYLYFNSNIRDIIYNKIPKGFIWENDKNSFADNKKQWAKDARRYAEQVEAFQQPVVVLERINNINNANKAPCYYLMRINTQISPIAETQREKQIGTAVETWTEKKENVTLSIALYRLPIISVELRLYRTGVMLLSIRCHNENMKNNAKGAAYQVCSVSTSGNITSQGKNDDEIAAERKTRIAEIAKKWFSVKEEKDIKLKPIYEEMWNKWNSSDSPSEPAGVPIVQAIDKTEVKFVTEQSDISWIEDAARRLFLARPCYDIFQGFPDEAPLYSTLCLDNDEGYTLCDYRPDAAVMYPEHIAWTTDVIGPFCHSIQAAAAEPEKKKNASGKENAFLIINCFNDDRMHVHGTIVSKELSARICSAYGKRYEQLDKDRLGQWYGMLAADNNWNSCTCQDQTMLLDLVDKQTDGRWSAWNTLYGITYHSMIQLLGPDAPAYLMTHMDWMYFQLFLIAVLQRCTVQRFYREASGLMRGNGSYDTKRGEALKSLYMLFMNQIWFNDVTEQEQGQDFFRRLQKNMDIEKDVSFLDQALSELDDQAHKKLENIVSRQLLPLSVIGGLWAGFEMISYLIDAEWMGEFLQHGVKGLETFFQRILAFDQLPVKSVVSGVLIVIIGWQLSKFAFYWARPKLKRCRPKWHKRNHNFRR